MGPYHALGAVKNVCTTGGRMWLVYSVQGLGMHLSPQKAYVWPCNCFAPALHTPSWFQSIIMGPYHALGAVKEVCTTGGRLLSLVYCVQGLGMRYSL